MNSFVCFVIVLVVCVFETVRLLSEKRTLSLSAGTAISPKFVRKF